VSNEPHEIVRDLWSRFAEGGIESVVDVTGPDVEWAPYMAGGRVFRGPDELREYARSLEQRGEVMEAAPYSFEQRGNAVIVSGYVRVRSEEGIAEHQLHWVYRFDGDRLLRAESYPTRAEAIEAVDEVD
jgi:ketosteroid isomerase-like protein